MKYVYMVVLGLFISAAVSADPRAELYQNAAVCHFPFSEQTDDEFKGPCYGKIKELDGVGGVAANFRAVDKGMSCAFVPEDTVVTSGPGQGATCKMINDDNQTYEQRDWVVSIETVPEIGTGRCTVVYELLCGATTFEQE